MAKTDISLLGCFFFSFFFPSAILKNRSNKRSASALSDVHSLDVHSLGVHSLGVHFVMFDNTYQKAK